MRKSKKSPPNTQRVIVYMRGTWYCIDDDNIVVWPPPSSFGASASRAKYPRIIRLSAAAWYALHYVLLEPAEYHHVSRNVVVTRSGPRRCIFIVFRFRGRSVEITLNTCMASDPWTYFHLCADTSVAEMTTRRPAGPTETILTSRKTNAVAEGRSDSITRCIRTLTRDKSRRIACGPILGVAVMYNTTCTLVHRHVYCFRPGRNDGVGET